MEATGKAYITSLGRMVYLVGPRGNFASIYGPLSDDDSARMKAESVAAMLDMKKGDE